MKKVISLLLALFTLCSVFCACAGSTEPADETTAAVVTEAPGADETTVVSTETEKIQPNVGDVTFDNYVFRVLTRGTSSSTWYSRDIYAGGITGEIISDAVYTRNTNMEEKYKFKVEEVGSSSPATEALAASASGDDNYAMYCFKIKDDITSIMLKGYLRNLNKVEKLDLDQPYYDQNSRKAFSLSNKLYLVTGDLLTMDNDATRCSLFNKEFFKDLGLESQIGGSLYKLSEDGTWTFEKMKICAAAATQDANGDGVMTIDDKWGMLAEQFNMVAFYNACGQLLFEKDADDVPYFAGNSEASLDALSYVVTLLNGDYCRKYTDCYTEAIPQFKEGLVLFYNAQLADVHLLREMEFDFGIVPLPKYTEDQENYQSTVTTYGSNCITIPTSVQDVDTVASIIEVLSCESMYVVTPAYFELNLKTRLARDSDSSPSIDTILSTACFELGYMWNWGSVYGSLTAAYANNTTNLAASFKSVEKVGNATAKKNAETVAGFAD